MERQLLSRDDPPMDHKPSLDTFRQRLVAWRWLRFENSKRGIFLPSRQRTQGLRQHHPDQSRRHQAQTGCQGYMVDTPKEDYRPVTIHICYTSDSVWHTVCNHPYAHHLPMEEPTKSVAARHHTTHSHRTCRNHTLHNDILATPHRQNQPTDTSAQPTLAHLCLPCR